MLRSEKDLRIGEDGGCLSNLFDGFEPGSLIGDAAFFTGSSKLLFERSQGSSIRRLRE